MSSDGAPKLSLTLKKKKSKSSTVQKAVQQEFGALQAAKDAVTVYKRESNEPLVIPAGENKLKFRSQPNETLKKESAGFTEDDAAAFAALQKEADGGASGLQAANRNNLVIQGNKNTFQRGGEKSVDSDAQQYKADAQQYKADLEALPDELPTDSESFQRVPIAEFGAALLRGMGWTGDDNDKKKSGKAKDDQGVMPRPHRLGLGATPAMDASMLVPTGRSRRPDQLKRQEALQKQQQEYARQREEQLARDKQRTMQNQSLVRLTDGKRALVLQLMGVPGLSMVKLQYEAHTEASIVKRGEIEGLLSREDLDQEPFQLTELHVPGEKGSRQRQSGDEKRSSSSRDNAKRDGLDNHSHREKDRKRNRDSDRNRSSRDEERRESSSSKRRREEYCASSSSKPEWVIPNIRVRVISEKLGRRHYKEKGIVVDVTPKGSTLKMANGTVVDRVPERYLETALPKVGGKAVVLAGEHRNAKGHLLERDSRRSRGVIQVFEDMNVLTLSLDDLAEWVGPLDDDIGV